METRGHKACDLSLRQCQIPGAQDSHAAAERLAPGNAAQVPSQPPSPFKGFHSSPEIIRFVVLMYVRFPLSLRNVEELLFERGIDICHETVRSWWNKLGPMLAADIRRQRVSRMRGFRHWNWALG